MIKQGIALHGVPTMNTSAKSGFDPIMLPRRLVLLAVLACAGVQAQDIYKTVDENGNVVYTDQKPSEDAVPMTLPELTVVDPVELGDPGATTGQSATNAAAAPQFNLAITAPAEEQTIVNTGYLLDVAVSVDRQLPSGARFRYLVDGEERLVSASQNVTLEQVWRGTHQLSVELVGQSGEPLGRAGPVTFYMRQHSAQHPPPGN